MKLFLSELKTTKQIEVNRHVLRCDMLDVDLHGFTDASRVAYGAVVYVRNVCRHGLWLVYWEMLCRTCKTNYGTKVRLLACVLLSKLIVSIKKAVTGLLNVQNVFCWSDS